ncbi:MAG: rhodanese-like domain-containing protein [Gemmatimonadota bacterium]
MRRILIAIGIVVGILALVIAVAGRPIAFAAVTRLTARKFPDVRWINGDELERWLADTMRARPLVLDARTDEEYGVSHLQGAARIDPYFPPLDRLAASRDTPIVVYSSVSYRSARVADRLMRMGFTRVYNLDGSLFAWANEGRVMFAGAAPTTRVHPYDSRWGLLLTPQHRADGEIEPIARRSAAP